MRTPIALRAAILAIAAFAGPAPGATAANPTIASASVTPSGELLYVVPHRADGTSALHAVSGVADGATITVDGVTTALDKPLWSDGWEGVLYPLAARVASGKAVTATFPAGAITVAGAATDAATAVPVTSLTDATFMYPVTPPAGRTLKSGYNILGMREDQISVSLADRSIGSDIWTGDVTLDARYEMTANAGAARRTLMYQPVADGGLTGRGAYLMDDGPIKVEFTASGAPFDAAARANVTLRNAFGGASTIGPATWTDLGNNRWRMTQAVTRPADGLWCQGLEFYANTPGVVYAGWKWFDARTPAGYVGTAHPDDVTRLKGWVGAIRSMDIFGTNFSEAALPGDLGSSAYKAGPSTGGVGTMVLRRANVTRIAPVDFASPEFARYFDLNAYCGWAILTVDDTTKIPPGVIVHWSGPVSSFAGNLGFDVGMGSIQLAFPLDATRVLVQFVCNTYDTTGNARCTVAAATDLTGTAVFSAANWLLPPATFFAYCSDLGASPWVNVPHAATDALIDELADLAIAGTPDGREVIVEYSNEIWNYSFWQGNYPPAMARSMNSLHAQDPVTYPYTYPSGLAWYAHQCAHVRDRFRAKFAAAGRDPNLVVGVLGSQTMNAGITEAMVMQLQAEGKTFDALAIETYQDLKPPGSDIAGPDVSGALGRLDRDGMIDVLIASSHHGSRPGIVAIHAAVKRDHGFAAARIVAYEGGPAYLSPTQPNVRLVEMMHSPRMYRYELAQLSFLQSLGYALDVRYTLAYYAQPGSNSAWTDLYTATQMPGTGSPAENPDWSYYPHTVSQPLGGRKAWGTGVDPDAATRPATQPAADPARVALIKALKTATAAQIDAVVAAAASRSKSVVDATAAAARAMLDLANLLADYLAAPAPTPAPAP